MNTVFVIGGNSVIGKSIINNLKKKGIDYIYSSRDKTKKKNQIYLDLNKFKKLEFKPKKIFFLAGSNSKYLKNMSKKNFFNLIKNTKKYLKYFNSLNAKIIFISSEAVFEKCYNKKNDIKSKTYPLTRYAIQKDILEKTIKNFRSKHAIIRISKIVTYKSQLFKNFYNKILKNKKILVFKDYYLFPLNLEFVTNFMVNYEHKGIIHLSGLKKISYYNFFLKIIKKLNKPRELLISASIKDNKYKKMNLVSNKSFDGLDITQTKKYYKIKFPKLQNIIYDYLNKL